MILLTLVCFLLIGALILEKYHSNLREKEWAAERASLLNRIQAPELAVLPEGEPVPYVAPDDDEGYWSAVEEREG